MKQLPKIKLPVMKKETVQHKKRKTDPQEVFKKLGAVFQLVANKKGLRRFLFMVKKALRQGAKIPVIGNYFEDLATMIDLLEDYAAGRYRSVPTRVIVVMVVALAYVVSPIDILPEFIPIIGQLDDAAIIKLALLVGVDAELKKYRSWKKKQQ